MARPLSPVIGMSFDERHSPVELFRQQYSYQPVGQRHVRERKDLVHGDLDLRIQSIGTPDDERDITAVSHPCSDRPCKLNRRQLLPAFIQCDFETARRQGGSNTNGFGIQ